MDDSKRALNEFANQTGVPSPASLERLSLSAHQMTEALPAQPLQKILAVRPGSEARVLARFRARASKPIMSWWVAVPVFAALAIGIWMVVADKNATSLPVLSMQEQVTPIVTPISPLPEVEKPLFSQGQPEPGSQREGPTIASRLSPLESPDTTNSQFIKQIASPRVVSPLPDPQQVLEPIAISPMDEPALATNDAMAPDMLVPNEHKPESVVSNPDLLPLRLASSSWKKLNPTDDVQLNYQGYGKLSGTIMAPKIAWDSGEIRVDVTPKKGIDLQVFTQEAEVHVVGTAFSVTRSPLGTQVSVDHGRVWVQCNGRDTHLLSANEKVSCEPVTPSGLLALALTQAEQGRPAQTVLATLERGILIAPRNSVIADELRFQRLRLWSSAPDQRFDAELDAFLASQPKARADEVRRWRIRRWVDLGKCGDVASEIEKIELRAWRTEAKEEWKRCH